MAKHTLKIFESIFGHFSTFWMKRLINFDSIFSFIKLFLLHCNEKNMNTKMVSQILKSHIKKASVKIIWKLFYEVVIKVIMQFEHVRGSQVLLSQVQFDPPTGSLITLSVNPNWHPLNGLGGHNDTHAGSPSVSRSWHSHMARQLSGIKLSPIAYVLLSTLHVTKKLQTIAIKLLQDIRSLSFKALLTEVSLQRSS